MTLTAVKFKEREKGFCDFVILTVRKISLEIKRTFVMRCECETRDCDCNIALEIQLSDYFVVEFI